MSISFDRALSIHPQALSLRLLRTELLSANLANADTPGFQAKDIDFAKEMQRSREMFPSASPQQMYRVPFEPALDGNTVSLHMEQAAFAKNVQDYQMSITFLTAKFRGLKQAIEGK